MQLILTDSMEIYLQLLHLKICRGKINARLYSVYIYYVGFEILTSLTKE